MLELASLPGKTDSIVPVLTRKCTCKKRYIGLVYVENMAQIPTVQVHLEKELHWTSVLGKYCTIVECTWKLCTCNNGTLD